MARARFIVGDVFDVLATLPDDSVDLVMSSPPFLALRSYLPADHPDKSKEIGSEATPADFLDTLLDAVEACDRVLAPHGSLVFELGDTYSGSGGAGGDYSDEGLRAGQNPFDGSAKRTRASGPRTDEESRLGVDARNRARRGGNASVVRDNPDGWPMPKSLCGIPTLFAWSLAYGRNLLRPERTTPPWRVRNVVAWARPNPPVGALGDKFRPATSYLTVACKARDRYFDLDAVRQPADEANRRPSVLKREGIPGRSDQVMNPLGPDGQRMISNPAGAPPLDYWVIPTQPYSGSHYATFPMDLCTRPIKAMCPLRVCRVCGKPSTRITETEYVRSSGGTTGARRDLREPDGRTNGTGQTGKPTMTAQVETIGWTDCGHDDWRTGIVLDPFAGSGTTLAVATGHGRDAIGIDVDVRNTELALERVGPMLLAVEHLAERVA